MSDQEKPRGVRARIEAAVESLGEVKKLNELLQTKCTVGSSAWQTHEVIDDKIFEALQALGN